jgi:membrane fusion protein (multidrug efflux system)
MTATTAPTAPTAPSPLELREDAVETEAASHPAPSLSTRKIAMGLALALILIGGGAYWYLHLGIESTDDAQVDADIVGVQSRYAGQVVEVRFEENQRVHSGDVLVVLDDAEARARLAQAEASLAAAEAAAEVADTAANIAATDAVEGRSMARATLQSQSARAMSTHDQLAEAEASLRSTRASFDRASSDKARQEGLFGMGAISAAQVEQVQATYRLAQAAVEAAEARLATLRSSVAAARGLVAEASAQARRVDEVDVRIAEARAGAAKAHADVEVARALRDLAKLDLDHTQIVAPSDGVVSKKTVAVGQVLTRGTAVGQLVTDERWVTANFKETQVGEMQVGHDATFTVDAFPGRTFHGTVESFAGATGSRFTLLPPDNASGNFTKVVQRLSVRIRVTHLPEDVALRPGMNVDIEVDTHGGGE